MTKLGSADLKGLGKGSSIGNMLMETGVLVTAFPSRLLLKLKLGKESLSLSTCANLHTTLELSLVIRSTANCARCAIHPQRACGNNKAGCEKQEGYYYNYPDKIGFIYTLIRWIKK